MKKEKIVIVGSGIAGITAAKLEGDKGNDVVLLDISSRAGGLLTSDKIEGHYFDQGTHIFPATGLKELDEILFGDLTEENYSITKLISAGNYFNGSLNEKSCYVDASTLPTTIYYQGCIDILGNNITDFENLEQWYDHRFGKTFSREIFCPVIKKYIGVDAKELPLSVGYFFDMSRVLAFDQDITETLGAINKYYAVLGHHSRKEGATKYYPKNGGVGQFIEDMMSKLDPVSLKVLLGKKILKIIESDGVVKEVVTESECFEVDRMIWTIPVSLLSLYLPLGVKTNPPKFRKTYLFDYIFDVPLLSNAAFINVYDLKLKSGRITLYQNLMDDNGIGRCTVEVLSDEIVTEDDIYDELVIMKLVDENASCTLKNKRIIKNGFPILDLDYVEQSKKQSKQYHDYFKNINFLGKASEKAFFMTDVLKETYNILVLNKK